MPEKVTWVNGKLQVPDEPIISFIEGDGIGPDIWKATVRVINAAVEKVYHGKRKIYWKEILAGEKAYHAVGDWLPQETVDTCKTHLIAIKGPLTTPIGEGFRSLNVTLRQELDLYACVRPVKWYPNVPSPLVHPEKVNMVIFRENTEDVYAGIEYAAASPEAQQLKQFLMQQLHAPKLTNDTALGIKIISEHGSKRLVRAAIRYALQQHLPSVTLVHKGNIMKYTEGAFRQWGYQVAEQEFAEQTFTWLEWERIKKTQNHEAADQALKMAHAQGKVIVKDIIADNFLQQLLLNPQDFSVIATMNLNGDYISDAAAAAVGGIGIAPGANINYETGHAVFEATHGTAPQFAHTDSMNPSSLILSAVMMLEYMGWEEAARAIVRGLSMAIMRKKVTIDFYRQMSDATLLHTSEFATEIIRHLDDPRTMGMMNMIE
ncbi:MAG: NADP-dependent isocitrate dehydrogenase [Thermoflavifilum sp.]|nr:NADP-dependent isocitrate dehydrogenase [Thermoflavifilum sp.]